jgi:hypothetical protein
MTRSLTLTAAALALSAAAMTSPAAAQNAQMVCGERVEIVNALESGHHEKKAAAGLSGNGGLVELFTGEAGTWTLLLTLPGGPTCLLGAGEAWEGWSSKGNGEALQPRNTSAQAVPDDLI